MGNKLNRAFNFIFTWWIYFSIKSRKIRPLTLHLRNGVFMLTLASWWTGFFVQKRSDVVFKQLMYWKENLSDCVFYLRLLYDNKRRNNNNIVTCIFFDIFAII